MRYCKKCGAEMPEGASFCEKCGNPVGKITKQGKGKKKWILVAGSGVIILAVATVGALFATGIIGGKDKAVKTSTDTANVQGTPSVTGEAIADTEELEGDKQKDVLENSNSEDMAWEAFQAYKKLIDDKREIYNEEYEEANKDSEDYEYDRDYYNDEHKFLLAYIDNDEYPELLVERRESILWVYTYKNDIVAEATSIESAGYGGLSSYFERSGYMYITDGGSDWREEEIYKLEETEVRKIYSNFISKDINTGEYTTELLGEEKILEQKGIAGSVWTPTSIYDEENELWNELWSNTIDEAYTQFLNRNKSN